VNELQIAHQAVGLVDENNEQIGWWKNNENPGDTVIFGLLDSGLDNLHPLFNSKQNTIIKLGEQLNKYKNDVRTPHGTGVAGIVAANDKNSQFQGIVYGIKNIYSALAGDEDSEGDTLAGLSLTLKNLDELIKNKIDAINYSFGNGNAGCVNYADCQIYSLLDKNINVLDWQPLARVVDYMVDTKGTSFLKSAGNAGWTPSTQEAPYANTLSTPADSYNAIVVANMDLGDYSVVDENGNPLTHSANRLLPHVIKSSSSRGPTVIGRKKPDLTAPGHNTRTAAPNPEVYYDPANFPKFKIYKEKMMYDPVTQTRLQTGTSTATPFITGSVLLIDDYVNKHLKEESSTLTEPMAMKALLINSADSWTDNGQPGPHDFNYVCNTDEPSCGHGPVYHSEWNRTYGWGYINLYNAFMQKENVILDTILPNGKIKQYYVKLAPGEKITLAWNRHVGFNDNLESYKLNQLNLKMIDPITKQEYSDTSEIDNIKQVSYGDAIKDRSQGEKEFLVIVDTPDKYFDGVKEEKFALSAASPIHTAPPDIN
jgi:serine protease AprX